MNETINRGSVDYKDQNDGCLKQLFSLFIFGVFANIYLQTASSIHTMYGHIGWIAIAILASILFYILKPRVKIIKNATLKTILLGLALLIPSLFLVGFIRVAEIRVVRNNLNEVVQKQNQELERMKNLQEELVSLYRGISSNPKNMEEIERNIKNFDRMRIVLSEMHELKESSLNFLEDKMRAGAIDIDKNIDSVKQQAARVDTAGSQYVEAGLRWSFSLKEKKSKSEILSFKQDYEAAFNKLSIEEDLLNVELGKINEK